MQTYDAVKNASFKQRPVQRTARAARAARAAIARRSRVWAAASGLLVAIPLASCQRDREPRTTPAGHQTTPKTKLLKSGAEVLQGNRPTDKLDVYLVGFHPLRDEPMHQMESHHYCFQVNEEFAQCALWDGNTASANLNGIEYIISERLYNGLPEEEKTYWHPHNYEILSGQLVAPGLPPAAEVSLMKGKMNSYGKTWHVWNTGGHLIDGDTLPLGPPRLAWSFNADGEASEPMIQRRDDALKVSTDEKREQRRELVELARPQGGVDLLGESYPGRKKPFGVAEAPPQ